MSKIVFTEKEIGLLTKNPYVQSVSPKGITYTEEFKRIFIVDYENGKLPRQIFEECGFDAEVIGKKRIQSSSDRWRKAYRENGVLGLKDTRSEASGRPRKHELSIDEKYARMEAQLNLLKAENELLKKIRFVERGLKK